MPSPRTSPVLEGVLFVSVRITRGAHSPQRSVGNKPHASKDEIAEVWPSVLDGASRKTRALAESRAEDPFLASMDDGGAFGLNQTGQQSLPPLSHRALAGQTDQTDRQNSVLDGRLVFSVSDSSTIFSRTKTGWVDVHTTSPRPGRTLLAT
ncbi:hypothetical protein F5144DRAFT_172305 [Chaetomium tenue]|uniref:Uncharacterized protein n=1 Tax=Chaetomium tenue TaxID=1854479 RepID=A0ACB7PGT4_9PEZI|nr:hypothetical protein F5144DRAFT_172305 [Chaetomium globosum]